MSAPATKQLEIPSTAIDAAIGILLQQILNQHPMETESLKDGCLVWVLSKDRKSNHLFGVRVV